MEAISVNTCLADVLQREWVKGWKFMVDPGLDPLLKKKMGDTYQRVFSGKTFIDLPIGLIPAELGAWNIPSIVDGMNFLQEEARERQIFYSIYSKEEQEKDPSKAKTGICAFPAPGADASARPTPFVLICPGGGYSCVCSLAEGFPIAMRLNQLGFSSFILQYRTGENARYPRPAKDLVSALRFIRDHAGMFHVNPEYYVLAGFSAGAHLAAVFCLEGHGARAFSMPYPSMLILGYPVVSMLEHAHPGSRNLLLGENPDPCLARSLSVELNADASFPRTFLWQCREDNTVPFIHSQMLAEKLSENSVPLKYAVYPGNAHGWGLAAGTAAEGWLDEAMDYCMSGQTDEGNTDRI